MWSFSVPAPRPEWKTATNLDWRSNGTLVKVIFSPVHLRPSRRENMVSFKISTWMCVNGTYYKSSGTSAHRFMGGNDKQKLTRFIINNFMLNLDSPLVPPLQSSKPPGGTLTPVWEYWYYIQCAPQCRKGEKKLKRSRGLISDSFAHLPNNSN